MSSELGLRIQSVSPLAGESNGHSRRTSPVVMLMRAKFVTFTATQQDTTRSSTGTSRVAELLPDVQPPSLPSGPFANVPSITKRAEFETVFAAGPPKFTV